MSKEKVQTNRLTLTLGVATIAHLSDLARLGTHGTSAADVAKTLIEKGIRDAISDGLLRIAADEKAAG